MTVRRRIRAAAHGAGGNVAMIVAIVLPAIAVCGAGATELAFLLSDRSRLQDAADAASLAAAHELALSKGEDVTERAKALALAQFQARGPDAGVTASAEIIDDGRAIRVSMLATRKSFFGNMLPPGGFKLNVSSTATGMGRTPLCVLARATKEKVAIKADGQSNVDAPGCLIHSNDGIEVKSGATLRAGAIQTVGSAHGATTPAVDVGSEAIKDPFESKWFTMPACNSKFEDPITTSRTIQPGVHCEDILIEGSARVTLAPGYHYFRKGKLIVKGKGGASLTGNGVTLFFDHDAMFEFKETAKVDLIGSQSGDFAGFVVMTLPKPSTNNNVAGYDYGTDFVISSNNVSRLDGVVYVPMARLIIEGEKGAKAVAEDSDWTVIVADHIELKGAPKLVINKDYGVPGAPPVPDGVGFTRSESRLKR